MKGIVKWITVLSVLAFAFQPACKTNVKETDDNPSEIAFEWINVPAGDFTFGSANTVMTIDHDYEIMKYEVTNAQYVAYLNDVVAQGDSLWSAGEYEYYDLDADVTDYTVKKISWNGEKFSIVSDYANHPVILVTWFGAYAFAKHYGYSLPTEQEWEKAARGNTGYRFPWGNEIEGARANYWDSGDPFDNGSTPVGYYNGDAHDGYQTIDTPGPYGAYDMAGNVWDWTDSYYSGDSNHRVARGGSFGSYSEYLYCYERHRYLSTFTDVNIGFRCLKRNLKIMNISID